MDMPASGAGQSAPGNSNAQRGGQPSTSGPSNGAPAEDVGQKRKADKPPKRGGGKAGGDGKRARVSQLFGEIAQHAKHNRLAGAMASFRAAVDEELPLSAGQFNTLLYLCCGGNNWEAYVRGRPIGGSGAEGQGGGTGDGPSTSAPPPTLVKHNKPSKPAPAPGAARPASSSAPAAATAATAGPAAAAPSDAAPVEPPPTKEELIAAANAVWTRMQQVGIVPDNVTYLSLARIAAIKSNPQGALHWAQTSVAAQHPVQLRLFHPALVAFTLAGDAAAVLDVDARIASFGKEQLDLGEYEYALLIEALTQHGTWAQVAGVLRRVGKELNQLSRPTLALLEAYFSGPRAAEAFQEPSMAEREAGEAQREAELLRHRREQQRRAAAAHADAQRWYGGKRGAAPGQPGSSAGGGAASSVPAGAGDAAAAAGPSGAIAEGGVDGDEEKVEEGEVALMSSQERRRRRPWLGYEGAQRWDVVGGVEFGGRGGGSREQQEAARRLRPAVVDLEEEEWASFSAAVAALAMSKEARKDDFQAYMDWFERNGPYDILIDGANVAFYGQNREGGGFNWNQVMLMVQMVQRQYPGRRALLMLHKKRVTDPSAQAPRVRSFLDGLKATKSFYCTPPGSNDDWYWLYATVKARAEGLLISNDELRDHIWSLLRPKHFLKWKSRHIAHYTFVPTGEGWDPLLTLPPPYTECVQELSDGSWVFPGEDGKWLCASPAKT